MKEGVLPPSRRSFIAVGAGLFMSRVRRLHRADHD
jgi:hypothetical protein